MSKLGDCFRNALNTKMNEQLKLISSIKVLVIDHKMDFLGHVADVLHSLSFEVTCVDQSGAALKLLSKKSSDFDLLLIDSEMRDVDVLTFLSLTKNMEVLPIVMSEQEDDAFLIEALKCGAFLVLKRPLTIDAVKHMRQDIIRERMLKHEKCNNENNKATTQAITIPENTTFGGKRKERSDPMKQVISGVDIINNPIRKSSYGDDHDSTKKKICVEWTQELHKKFLDAVNDLGEGRCFPNEILKRMEVPGLTRMQVASHLQKCRREKSKSSEMRRASSSSNSYTFPGVISPLEVVSERKFGCMPVIQTDQKVQEDRSTVIGINLSINGWPIDEKHKNEQSYRGLTTMNGFVQKNIAQPTYDILFPMGNGLDTTQHEGIGSRVTKTTNNYFLQALSGSHDVEQGGSNPYNYLSIPIQNTDDDFPDLLKDIDGNGPNDDFIS